ncbi:MAG TPA: tetratricopeptide repeat protein [Chthonomonadaceae bacterium]|nr:tetratricopeptide repeat protein [Chthonomonadaceae bacterium]
MSGSAWWWRAARKWPEVTPAIAYTQQGKRLATEGNITEAVVAFNRGIALEPTNPQPYIGLAVLYESVNRPDLAIETLEQLRAANPQAKGLSCRLAEAYLGAEDLPQARDWGQKAVAEGADPARAHSVYGITMLRFRYWDTAIQHLQQAWKLAPDDLDIPLTLMEAYLQQGDYARVIQVGEQLLPRVGDSPRLHYKLGWAYCRQPQRGDTTERAITHLKKASELAPQWFEPYAELGRLYRSLGNNAAALDCFQRAWELDPTAAGVASNLAALLRQRGDKRSAQVEAAFQRLLRARERFTALRRGYNSPAGQEDRRNVIALAATEGRFRQYGTALHRLQKWLSEDPADLDALALYVRLDQEARARYPDYLRPGPGISTPGR